MPLKENIFQGFKNRYRLKKHAAKRQIDAAIKEQAFILSAHDGDVSAFFELLHSVQARSDLVKAPVDFGRHIDMAVSFIGGLGILARHHGEFIRSIETWDPAGQRGFPAFGSLVEHLLAEHPIPRFMHKVFLQVDSPKARKQRSWCIQASRGKSIRRLDIPVFLTRKMEHFFLHASDHLTMEQAFRYAQVRGLGGSHELAEAIVATRLGEDLSGDAFWRSVMRFFVGIENLDLMLINPIVDYLYYAKFSQGIVEGAFLKEVNPPDPDFSMKGRTLASMMRRVDKWHKDLGRVRGGKSFWASSGFAGFCLVQASHDPEKDPIVWSIAELLSGKELAMEGSTMRHCVSTYTGQCMRRSTTIWSLTRQRGKSRKCVCTIEVEPHKRTIIQAKGKCNAKPSRISFEIMRTWASKEGFRISKNL